MAPTFARTSATWARTEEGAGPPGRFRRIQALDRTQPILPVRPGLPERATHDYRRHGTTTLFAALEVATGRVTDHCFDRHATRSSWPS
jgi:hypothetical protein